MNANADYITSTTENKHSKQRIDIIVVNWNTKELLRNCLRSVREHGGQCLMRLIVVDNGSSDGSPEMVKKEFPDALLIRNEQNLGFGAATNQGLAVCDADYALLLNSDTVVMDNSIERCVAFAEGNVDVAAVGCKILWPDGTRQPSAFRFPSVRGIASEAFGLACLFNKSQTCNYDRYGFMEWTEPTDCDVIAGCFMLVRRNVINHVGNLNQSFFMYGEETEWCYRMQQKGYRVVYYPSAQIIHYHKGSCKNESMRWWARRCSQQSQLLFLSMKHGVYQAIVGSMFYALGEALRGVFAVACGILMMDGRRFHEASARLEILVSHLLSIARLRWSTPRAPEKGLRPR